MRWLAKLRADELELHVTSEEGAYATATLPGPFGEAKKPEQVPGQIADLLSQLGTTIYHAEEVEVMRRRRSSSPTRNSRRCAAKPSRH